MEITFGSKSDNNGSNQKLTKLEVGNEKIIKKVYGDDPYNAMNAGNSEKPEKSEEKKERIFLDGKKVENILELCIKDLKFPRKINGKDFKIISDFNEISKTITFESDIKELQKILSIKEETLAEFFSWFFVSNFRKYCMELFDTLPESMPIYTIDEINSKTIKINFV